MVASILQLLVLSTLKHLWYANKTKFHLFHFISQDVYHCITCVSMQERCEMPGIPVQMKLRRQCFPSVSEHDSRGYHLERRNMHEAIKKTNIQVSYA